MIACEAVSGREWDRDVLALLLLRLPAVGLGPAGSSAVPDGVTDLVRAGLGSVMLPPGTGLPAADLAALSRTVHELSEDCAVLVAEEGGDTSVLQAEGSSAPTARALGVIDDVGLTRQIGDALGDVLAACDVDLVLGPILDVATGPDPLSGHRSFGSDPDLVERHARAWASGVRDAGIAVCGMHFPGIGALPVPPGGAATDPAGSMITLPRAQFVSEHLGAWDLVPWLDAVFAAPVGVTSLGAGPASLAAWTGPLLDELSHAGYHGLRIAGNMVGSARVAGCSISEAALLAVETGAHLLDLGPAGDRALAGAIQVHDALVGAMVDGRITERRLRGQAEATRSGIRALRARRRWLTAPELSTALTTLETLGAAAALRAVTVRRARLDLRPVAVIDLGSDAGSRFPGSAAFPGPLDVPAPLGAEHVPTTPAVLIAALRSQGITAEAAAYEQDALQAPQLLVLTRRPRTDPDESARLQRILAARPDAVVIHTGSPQTRPDHDRLVLANGAGRAMMQAVVSALLDTGQ